MLAREISAHAADAYELVGYLDDNPDIGLVITDVMMPEMSGRELVHVLRGLERFAALPVVIISAVVGERDMRDLIALGASRFLRKPVSLPLMREFLQQLIGAASPAA